jgi:ribonuclease Z
VSCKKFAAHIGDTLFHAGEIAQRVTEDKGRPSGRPAELTNVITFEPGEGPQSVWTLGEVPVHAIRSTHMPGHASYRVDMPAGSMVIGGDAGNDKSAPPRDYSTSKLAKVADVMVHSVIHPIMATRAAALQPQCIIVRARWAICGRWPGGRASSISCLHT